MKTSTPRRFSESILGIRDMKASFQNRADAGRQLARQLAGYADRGDVLVLGLPRGGVPVAFEVAQKIHAPLEVMIVRKLGVPGHEELAMGAIATGGIRVLNESVIRSLRIPDRTLEDAAAAEEVELKRRERIYRGHEASWEVGGKTVILIDDGIATGSTMRAAIQALRKQQPARLVVAVPYASSSVRDEFEGEVDDMVVLDSTESFWAVGQAYEDFSQVTDAEVTRLMEMAGARANLPLL
jgi:putative phosphoribosyl transferase